MHPALIETLARQRIADMRAALVRRHRLTGQVSEPAAPIGQRVGWVLVQVGLRLAVRQARS
jgi:hypothetical protein